MRLIAIKHLRNRLALVGRERGDKNERLDSVSGRRSDDGASVSVAGQDHWATGSFEDTIQSAHVISQRREWNRSADDLKTVTFEWQNDIAPTRPVRTRPVYQNNRRVLRKGLHLATALSPLARLKPSALRNFFIAEAISATCVSIAKCPVSKN